MIHVNYVMRSFESKNSNPMIRNSFYTVSKRVDTILGAHEFSQVFRVRVSRPCKEGVNLGC